ncbi:hypothetical protein ACXDF8_05235 [Mycolicibacterium sp. CBM1]
MTVVAGVVRVGLPKLFAVAAIPHSRHRVGAGKAGELALELLAFADVPDDVPDDAEDRRDPPVVVQVRDHLHLADHDRAVPAVGVQLGAEHRQLGAVHRRGPDDVAGGPFQHHRTASRQHDRIHVRA